VRSTQAMFFFVYVLGSRRKNDRRTYVGWTTDLKRRLQQHNAGRGAKSTRGRNWILLYSECCKTRSEAMSREWHIKHDRKFRRHFADNHSNLTPQAALLPESYKKARAWRALSRTSRQSFEKLLASRVE
jgi:putative endonuclease